MKIKKFWNWTEPAAPTEERQLFFNGEIAEETWWGDEITPKIFRDELEAGSGPVKVHGLAASAASVIAMAGDSVLMSPTAMMMIHNPLTIAMGDSGEMQKAIELLNETKESIINAYEIKTGLSRTKLAHLMDAETWLSANKAIELGFADDILTRRQQDGEEPGIAADFTFSRRAVTNKLLAKLPIHNSPKTEEKQPAEPLYQRLNLLKF